MCSNELCVVYAAAWLYWLQGLCGIICLLKSGISLLHLITASQNMAALDTAEREKNTKSQWERSERELQLHIHHVLCFIYLYFRGNSRLYTLEPRWPKLDVKHREHASVCLKTSERKTQDSWPDVTKLKFQTQAAKLHELHLFQKPQQKSLFTSDLFTIIMKKFSQTAQSSDSEHSRPSESRCSGSKAQFVQSKWKRQSD